MKITHKKVVSSTETIECDALKPISNLIQKLSKSLWSSLKRLINEGITVEKSEEGKDGIFYLRAKTSHNNQFLVKCSPVPHNRSQYDLFFITEDGPERENRLGVPESDIADVIGEWAYERFDEDDYKLSELMDDDTGEDKLATEPDVAESELEDEGE